MNIYIHLCTPVYTCQCIHRMYAFMYSMCEHECLIIFCQECPRVILTNYSYSTVEYSTHQTAALLPFRSGELGVWRTLLAGGVAGVMDWLVAMPIDVLKSRLQTGAHALPSRALLLCNAHAHFSPSTNKQTNTQSRYDARSSGRSIQKPAACARRSLAHRRPARALQRLHTGHVARLPGQRGITALTLYMPLRAPIIQCTLYTVQYSQTVEIEQQAHDHSTQSTSNFKNY